MSRKLLQNAAVGRYIGEGHYPQKRGGKLWELSMAEASLLCDNESERENSLQAGRKQHV